MPVGPVAMQREQSLPAIVAHRGASADAPDNTLDAFALAWEQGADAIEGDFHLTRDRQIACHHDPEVVGPNGAAIPVSELSLQELKSVPGKERIPVLREVMETVPAGKRLFIEIKCGPQIVDPLLQEIRSSGLAADQVTIISFNQGVITAIKKTANQTAVYWLVDFKGSKLRLQPNACTIRTTAAAMQCDGVGLKADLRISSQFVSSLHDGGFRVNVWTVDSAMLARHFTRRKVDSITTNRPGCLRTYLKDQADSC